ncbi:MAG TPA: alpha/beta hydrolase [Solirubrobacterales bacterium]
MSSPLPADLPHVDGVDHRWVEARGLRFHVAEAGAGDDVVLCLHGWPQHWYLWRRILPALADRHRVLALDLRGFGWSDAPPSGYEKENLATDVLAVLDQLGLERVKLIGHDWGGWIGFLICLREPQRVERFLALGIPPPWVPVRQALPHSWRLFYQLLVASPGLGALLHRRGNLVPRTLVAGSTVRDPWDEATLRAFADRFEQPDRARAAVQLYRVFQLKEMPALMRGRYRDRRLTVPTRLVNGADDFATRPGMVAGTERQADDMQVELVEGCGHFVVDERPDLVIARAREFLGGSEAKGQTIPS